MKMRKEEQPLVMMKMKVKTRVIVVVTTTTVMVDMMMMTIVVEVMIAHTMEMIEVNPLVIEKMKMRTYSMRSMTMIWTIMMKT